MGVGEPSTGASLFLDIVGPLGLASLCDLRKVFRLFGLHFPPSHNGAYYSPSRVGNEVIGEKWLPWGLISLRKCPLSPFSRGMEEGVAGRTLAQG